VTASPLASTDAPAAPVDRFAAIVGARNVLTADADLAPYLVEWRGLYHGRTPAVLRPGSTAEVAAILALANETRTPIIVQGGNTGLVGGQVPDESGREVVLSLARLDRVREVDAAGGTMTVEAGCILDKIHAEADAVDRLFPLTLGSQGSCRIGGNLSTNAGGTAVLAYGNARDLVLGLEVVLPTGEIWDGLRKLRKDNTGYDLKQLFVGAEGTLGVITAAVLKLLPKPVLREVAFIGVETPEAALELFNRMRGAAGSSLTGFELMERVAFAFALRHLVGARNPLSAEQPWYVLAELSSGSKAADVRAILEEVLAGAFEDGVITDAALAESLAQADAFWHLRHGLSEVQAQEGGSIKHDVSVPVAAVPTFLARATAAVEALVPGCRPAAFGHMGDGNIHFNVSQPVGADKAAYLAGWDEMGTVVHGIVADLGGSISAEHGIGRLKRHLLPGVKSALELDMMRRVKAAFDPNGILNPGRVL
jgi:FAD/FMN-containing dehydrogenase